MLFGKSDVFRKSLLRELEFTSSNGGDDPMARRIWLLDQLDNYLDRWLGFAELGTIPMKSLLKDDLFAMLLAGVEVYSREIKRVKSPVEEKAWQEFRVTVDEIKNTGNAALQKILREKLTEVRKQILSASTSVHT